MTFKTPEEPTIQNPTLALEQMNKGKYTQTAIIKMTPTFYSNEQMMDIIEIDFLKEMKDAGMTGTFEEGLLYCYNNNTDNSYTTIEETGKTIEELTCLVLGNEDGTTTLQELAEQSFWDLASYEITRPDDTVFLLASDEPSLNGYVGELPEGIGSDSDYNDEEFYSAKQLGTYNFKITVGEYVITSSITIDEF